MAEKAPLTVKDFEGLTIPQLKSKLQETTDLVLLSQVEELEKSQKDPRSGALSAINERQGEVAEFAKEQNPDILEEITPTNEVATITDDEQPEKTPEEEFTDELIEQDKEELIAEIKKHRVEIDRIYQFAKHHLRISTGCEGPLFKAKAWLGVLLSTLGTENPYNVEVNVPSDIPATAEKNEGTDFILKRQEFSNLNPIPAVVKIREDIAKVAELVDDLNLYINFEDSKSARRAAICRTQAWVNLSEARFELGQDLARIRG